MTLPTRKRVRLAKSRKAAAVVEFAVCLPVILLVVFGSIEAASMLFLRQAAIQSAYEGVKVAIRDNVTDADAIAAAESVIAGRRLTGVNVEVTPANVGDLDSGDLIQVEVTVPSDENTLFPFGVFRNREVNAVATMVKE